MNEDDMDMSNMVPIGADFFDMLDLLHVNIFVLTKTLADKTLESSYRGYLTSVKDANTNIFNQLLSLDPLMIEDCLADTLDYLQHVKLNLSSNEDQGFEVERLSELVALLNLKLNKEIIN